MKFNYKFRNLLGTVYRRGNLLFTPDGSKVISPVGNKLSVFDCENHGTWTLESTEIRNDFVSLSLSPDGISLLASDEKGVIYFISLISRSVLSSLVTDRDINVIAFSPDAKHFAISKENQVLVYKSPGPQTREYRPFILEYVLRGAYDDVTSIAWSSDSKVIGVGSKDASTRLYPLEKYEQFSIYTLGGNTEPVLNSFFEKDSLFCYTLSRNGQLAVWENSLELSEMTLKTNKKKSKKNRDRDEDPDDLSEMNREAQTLDANDEQNKRVEKFFYKRLARHFLRDQLPKDDENKGRHNSVELSAADYNNKNKIMVTGFSNGVFFIHEMPDVNLIHSLAISDHEINTIKINVTGDWIAFGCANQGQLLVWEWQSETYVLKQQGHYNNLANLTYSPDGSVIATGGEDGKIKLWNTSNGFCFVTFTEHTSAVSGVTFTGNGKVIISSSMDGTVRAYDMARYRNFRTFTSPRPAQFSCVATDVSGELVAAGGQDVYEIYLWSLKTGKLLEVIAAHEGPVTSLRFSPSLTSSTLVSVSWDKTLRLWNSLSVSSGSESVILGSDGICVTFRPDGQEVAVSTLNGQISFFDVKTSTQLGTIEGRNDLGSGRSDTDLITAKKSAEGKAFTALCYSADGSYIIAGGTSKNVCIYHVETKLLIKKFELTQNRSLDAIDDVINRKKMTEFGNMALVEDRLDDSNTALKLPGTKRGDKSSRAFKPEVRVTGVEFSSTGREFAVSSTEGLLIYSLDNDMLFDPMDLSLEITPNLTKLTSKKGEHGNAIMMALKLNEYDLIRQVLESVPMSQIKLICKDLPDKYISKILKYLGSELEESRHLHFYALWILDILTIHGLKIKKESKEMMPILNNLLKNLTSKSSDLADICNHNMYTIKFLLSMNKLKKLETAEKSENVIDECASSEDEDDFNMSIDGDNLVSNWNDDNDDDDN